MGRLDAALELLDSIADAGQEYVNECSGDLARQIRFYRSDGFPEWRLRLVEEEMTRLAEALASRRRRQRGEPSHEQ